MFFHQLGSILNLSEKLLFCLSSLSHFTSRMLYLDTKNAANPKQIFDNDDAMPWYEIKLLRPGRNPLKVVFKVS